MPCTGNRTFSYNSEACDRTCLSLSDRETECHASAVPVDGCNCPEGTYLNHKAECVHKAQCPCLLDGSKFVQADQSTMINGVIWYGRHGWAISGDEGPCTPVSSWVPAPFLQLLHQWPPELPTAGRDVLG